MYLEIKGIGGSERKGGNGTSSLDVNESGELRLRSLIEETIVSVFGVGRSELRGLSRGRQDVAQARQIAMYLAHVSCGLSMTRVGVIFGRDRTTIAHACSVIEDRRDDESFDYILELLERVALSNIRPREFEEPLSIF